MSFNQNNLFKFGDTLEGQLGYYVILKKLGNGGNGTAYLALSTSGCHSGCYFVIKILYKIDQEDRVERFKKEIDFLSTSNHPSIIKLYEHGYHTINDQQIPYYVMDYMPTTLENVLCSSGGKLPLEKAFLYTTQLLSALQYLQSKKIVHRDIKPENIFINGNHVILGDFGLIKDLSTQTDITQSEIKDLEESIFSSISNGNAMPYNYRTPQLVNYINKKGPLSLKSDIFQLGITLMIMFTGEHPLNPTGNKGKSSDVTFKHPFPQRYNSLLGITHGIHIRNILNGMITEDENFIKSPEKLLEMSNLTLQNFLECKLKLDGQILI